MTENRDELVRRVADSREVLNGIQQLRNGNWSERLLVETILEVARSLTDGGKESINVLIGAPSPEEETAHQRVIEESRRLLTGAAPSVPEQSGFVREPTAAEISAVLEEIKDDFVYQLSGAYRLAFEERQRIRAYDICRAMLAAAKEKGQ
jgi:hypothetical protein